MKKALFVFVVILLALPIMAQQKAPAFVYCEIVGYQKLLSNKVTIRIDMGDKMKAFASNRLVDQNTGKPKVFNTMIDALNYMGKQGWEFVQAYNVPVGDVNYYHYVMKKPFADLDESDKAEIMKEE